jgi:hypothetical protein
MSCCIEEIDLKKFSKIKLLKKCEELGIKKCKSKNKEKLIELINKQIILLNSSMVSDVDEIKNISVFKNYTLVDLFCGTGHFHMHFIKQIK